MADEFQIESASGGGGDFIPKDKYFRWAQAGVTCLCRIVRVWPKGSMVPGFRDPCDPVTVDMLVMTEPPTVYRSEEMTNAGFTRKLRERETGGSGPDGKPLTEPRQPGQLVAGRFGTYLDKRHNVERPCINPATEAEVEVFKQLAAQHGDLFDHFDRLQLLAAAAAVGSNGGTNGQTAPSQPAPAAEQPLPF